MRTLHKACWLVATPMLLGFGCAGLPPSIRQFAAELPARADGQYALLDPLIRKQLVMKDALLQCRIDLEDGLTEQQAASCRCAESASADWLADCHGWLGAHTPTADPPEPADNADAPISLGPTHPETRADTRDHDPVTRTS